MEKGDRSQRAGTHLKSVVLKHTGRRPRERLFATEVRQHSLQSPRFSPRGHSQPRRKRTYVALGGTAKDALLHADQPKNTPPVQRFFLRLSTVGSSLASSVLDPLLRPHGPLAHGGIAQPAYLF